jgi:hypothetical protein
VEDTGTGITQAEGDLRYLKFPSAQGIETFPSGLTASSISSLGATTALSIASNQTGAGTVALGATTNTSTTINGTVIKQVVPLLTGGTLETVIGNTTNVSSMSTTFNKKNTGNNNTPLPAALLTQPCFTIVSPAFFTCQYFEIIVSGSNYGPGGYSYKGCFSLNYILTSNSIVASSVSTLFSFGGTPEITITMSGTNNNTATVNVQTANITAPPGGLSVNQNFIATLVAYPTLTLTNTLQDYAITAIPT